MTIGPFGYDGFGVNDHADEYHPRIATFTGAYRGRDDIGYLLAAAPDLLAALESFFELDACNDQPDALTTFDEKHSIKAGEGRYSYLFKAARAAIAKAKGL